MLTIRKAQDRGHANHGWLDSHHTFSFADYHDPRHMGFRGLRVINEDTRRPRQGFGTHGHRDMEIISYVLEGALEHKDSMGTGEVIKPGDVQRMSAGSGVRHSEYNASKAEAVHFLQIWIVPNQRDVAPSYEQKTFSDADKRGRLRLVASSDGREGSVRIHADADVYATLLGEGARASHQVRPGRGAWVHVARGAARVNGASLGAGDGASLDEPGELVLEGAGEAEILVFESGVTMRGPRAPPNPPGFPPWPVGLASPTEERLRMIPARFTNLDAARARFGDRVERLAPYLVQVDPLADAAAEALAALPPGRGFALLDEALERGVAAVSEAPPAVRALFAEADRVPPWVDWTALDRGGELLMRAGVLGGMVLGARSIVLGYASPGGNKPLIFSGRLREQAARRLNETARFVQAVCRPGGMRRHADGFKITLKVRLIHAEVRRMILRSGRWDEARWGAPINQHDMAATTLLFSMVVLDGLRLFGLAVSDDEAESYLQLWRYVGRVMGCDPELTPTGEMEARRLADLIAATQGPPDDDSRALTHAFLHAGAEVAKTPGDLRRAHVETELGQGLVRGLLGDAMADDLGVPATRWRLALPLLRGVNVAAEQVRQRLPAAQRAAVVQGNRYWDRVVEIGLAGATAEFRPPSSLSASQLP